MGCLLHDKGEPDLAKPFFRRYLEGCERIHGPDHPATLIAVGNMGQLLQAKGERKEAIIMVGPLGRVGQRLLLRGFLLAPNQIIARLDLGPRIVLGEVKYRLKIKGAPTSVESGKTRSGKV